MIINRFKKIDKDASRQLLSKIQTWRTQFSQIPPNDIQAIERSKNEIAPLLFQALIESDKPLGLYLPKQLFLEALNQQNKANWDFIVCYVGTEEPETPKMAPKLRPTFKFYKGGKDTDGQFIPVSPVALHFSKSLEGDKVKDATSNQKQTNNLSKDNDMSMIMNFATSDVGGCANSTPPPR